MEHEINWQALAWAAGWLPAVLALFWWGIRLPLAQPGGAWPRRVRGALIVFGGVAAALLAMSALTRHDSHVDLTREKLYTPSATALSMARGLREPVSVTYFFQGQDPNARRARDMLLLMARENALLTVTSIDPDKQPSLAATRGVKMYNAALIEAAGRRVIVQGTDEADFAIGIQRALRERQVVLQGPLQHAQTMLGQAQLAEDLRVQQAHGVAGGGVAKARVELLGHRRAAGDPAPLEQGHLQARPREVRRAGQAVVAGPDDRHVQIR